VQVGTAQQRLVQRLRAAEQRGSESESQLESVTEAGNALRAATEKRIRELERAVHDASSNEQSAQLALNGVQARIALPTAVRSVVRCNSAVCPKQSKRARRQAELRDAFSDRQAIATELLTAKVRLRSHVHRNNVHSRPSCECFLLRHDANAVRGPCAAQTVLLLLCAFWCRSSSAQQTNKRLSSAKRTMRCPPPHSCW
jgi:hypothetical protein